MSILTSLEHKFGRLAIDNLTLYILGGQVLAYLLSLANPLFAHVFVLQGNLVTEGQWWRLITFIFTPLGDSPLFVVLAWYFFYLFSTALEQVWGSFRYMVYVFIGVFATILCAFIFPALPITNRYLFTSLFVAFCYLFPEHTVLIFFVLPVKMKWLGLLAWIGVIGSFLAGTLDTKVLIVFSLLNFILFFGSDLLTTLGSRSKNISRSTGELLTPSPSYMMCAVCHKTEHDKKIFSYCHTCIPETMYCEDHIDKHTHKKSLTRAHPNPSTKN